MNWLYRFVVSRMRLQIKETVYSSHCCLWGLLNKSKLLWPEMQALWVWSYQVILLSNLQVHLRCKYTSKLQIFPGIFAPQVCWKLSSYFDLKCRLCGCEVIKLYCWAICKFVWDVNTHQSYRFSRYICASGLLKDSKLLWPEMQALWSWSNQVILLSNL